jgi:glycosidase
MCRLTQRIWPRILTCLLFGAPLLAARAAEVDFRSRLPQDEVIYFLLPDRFENGDPANDRGGMPGDRLITGFDPTAKEFYHGGDLEGLIARLDYIRALGATALWLAPIFKNKAVQGPPGHESAGYHGYWITDFTRVDPHFGTDQDLRALVAAVHARGMKIYLDIVTNHTADVIAYRECPANDCVYRSRADFPYTRHGGVHGELINSGFSGDGSSHQTQENFSRLTRPDYAYAPYVREGEEKIKVPTWLNDPIYYHNRGNGTFRGESSLFGDFAGLDDLMTENPQVREGMIQIYRTWIQQYAIDGFRVDSARHVNPEFWQAFVPAMLECARLRGIPNFHIFGEVTETDPGVLARYTRVDKLPAVLNFAFAAAVRDTVAGTAGTDILTRVFEADALYEGGAQTALQLATFISNHDQGRFAAFVRATRATVSDEEAMKRVLLAHAILLTLRGAPVIYYGDEQGFVGGGRDEDARQDMFASRVASYNSERRLGLSAATPRVSFDSTHPLYQGLVELARLRREQAALRRGRQVVRSSGPSPGLFAVSRFDPDNGRELLIAFNTSTEALRAQVLVDAGSVRFRSLHGSCAAVVTAPGTYVVTVEALDYVVCAAIPQYASAVVTPVVRWSANQWRSRVLQAGTHRASALPLSSFAFPLDHDSTYSLAT